MGTPIGNLEDISLRALRVLNEVGLIACEDTRTTKKLLNKYMIKTKLTSYYEYKSQGKLSYLLDYLNKEDLALVSEAGMPGLSDPGYRLITAAIRNNIKVTAVPGVSAIPVALILSGLPVNQFVFLGFLPRKARERQSMIRAVADECRTLIIFEAPHRLKDTLGDVLKILGNRQIAICRELTKLHEEIFRGTVVSSIEHFKQPRGEFTLVISGNQEEVNDEDAILEARLIKLRDGGYKARQAIEKLAGEKGVPRNKLYKIWISQSKGDKK